MKLGYDVTFIRNVTDIDDKVLISLQQLDSNGGSAHIFYEREFTGAYNLLDVLPPT